MTVTPGPVVVVKGSSVTLVCNTTGIPAPSIEWTRYDQPGDVLSNTSKLTLENVQRPGNADESFTYKCSASNGFGSPDRGMVKVLVHCKLAAK